MPRGPAPSSLNIAERLTWRAKNEPDRVAIRVEDVGAARDGWEERYPIVTYAALHAQALKVAEILVDELGPSSAERERVILAHEPGLDFVAAFFGCLYARRIAVPVQVPRQTADTETRRWKALLHDAKPSLILTNSASREWLSEMNAIKVCGPDSHSLAQEPGHLNLGEHDASEIAFLQYTSGSTGDPKGVAVTLANLTHNLEQIRQRFDHNRESRGVIWLPPFHDMGLIGGILQPIHTGFPVLLMPPMTFIRHPYRWLEAISQFRATTSGGPNFAYEYAARKVTTKQRATLDLSAWSVAFVGAEKVHPKSLLDFSRTFADCGFRESAFLPCYGLAEATLMVSAGRWHYQTASDAVSCGRPTNDLDVRIVDPETRMALPAGETGEIWVAGPSVAAGYWKKEATDIFEALLASDEAGPNFLRTGDLGFLREGELCICGRIKDLIVIRGQNYIPTDLEACAARASDINPDTIVALSVEDHEGERIVLICEQPRGGDGTEWPSQMRGAISTAFALEVHDVVVVKSASLPRTTSGKLRRHACRSDYMEGRLVVLSQSLSKPDDSVDETSATEWRTRLITMLSQKLKVSASAIDPKRPLAELGIDSLMAVEIAQDLTAHLHLKEPLDPTLAWRFPTVDALGDHLSQIRNKPSATRTPITVSESQIDSRIAIVGMACRFPGGADSPRAFWKLLQDGVDAVTGIPADRWDVDRFFDPDPGAPGKMYTRSGAFIDGVADFDPEFFSISPREAAALDPQQRLLLETSYLALKDASLSPFDLRGSKTGVYVGLSLDDYAQLSVRSGDPSYIDQQTALGSLRAVAAGRIAYAFGLQGPVIQLDTTCSSSLVSAHLACQALRQGEADLALAGGVNLILAPEAMIACCKLRALSAEGRCFTFSNRANGYVRGEGAGMITLQRLSDAVSEGKQIYGVISGSAVNHDGVSNGLTAPNTDSQIALIQQALQSAGLDSSQIDYVETHGTGTPLGDPIELQALHEVFGARPNPLPIGSVKTNIGHLESAAGIASLIKIIVSMQQGSIPAHLHASSLSERFDWDKSPLDVSTTMAAWPSNARTRRAGVSSFGLSGTNAHLIVERPDGLSLRESLEDLPVCPFKRKRYWFEPSRKDKLERLPLAGDSFQCFVGRLLASAWASHRVKERTLLPATGHLWQLLCVADLIDRDAEWTISEMRLLDAFWLDSESVAIQVHVTTHSDNRFHWRLYGEFENGWKHYSEGFLEKGHVEIGAFPKPSSSERDVSKEELYQAFSERQIDYGPMFRLVSKISVQGDLAWADLSIPTNDLIPIAAFWDAGFQVAGVLLDDGHSALVPVSVNAFHGRRSIPPDTTITAQCRGNQADVTWVSKAEGTIAQLRGLSLKPLKEIKSSSTSPYIEITWQEQPLQSLPSTFLDTPSSIAYRMETTLTQLRHSIDVVRYREELESLNALANTFMHSAVKANSEADVVPKQKRLFQRMKAVARQEFSGQAPAESAESKLIQRVGERLPEILKGQVDPVQVLFPDGEMSVLTDLYQDSPGARLLNTTLTEGLRLGIQTGMSRRLRVLEIGAGTGGTSLPVVQQLRELGIAFDYHFTDISPLFLKRGQQRLQAFDEIQWSLLNIEESPPYKELPSNFDVILASNVIHATKDITRSLGNVRELLAPGGHFFLLEATEPLPWLDLVFGVTEGWWRFEDTHLRPDHPLLPASAWCESCQAAGFDEVALLGDSVILAQRSTAFHELTSSHEVTVIRGTKQWIITLPTLDEIELVANTSERMCATIIESVQEALQLEQPVRFYVLGSNRSEADAIVNGAVWGLMQTIAIEHPELRATWVTSDDFEAASREILSQAPEMRVEWKAGVRRVAHWGETSVQPSENCEGKQLVIETPGTLDGLTWQSPPTLALGSDDVEISVDAVGINFRDVLIAMGLYPEPAVLGSECSGVVNKVGSDVKTCSPGDRVMAIASGCFANRVTISQALVLPIPNDIDAVTAASVPICFATAYHSLVTLAQLQRGESILIHAATGGVGQAAIQIAQTLGVRVFATASSSKWPVLQKLGIDHVMDSRTLEFRDSIHERTGGMGVNAVLNCLPGDARRASLDVVSKEGRFVEIGKGEGLMPSEIASIRPDVSHHVFDLSAYCASDPDAVRGILEVVLDRLKSGDWKPLPIREFAWSEIPEAFRLMQSSKHTGKLVVHKRSITLITGGLGGLGLATAEWLVDRGDRHLLLLTRNGPTNSEQSDAVKRLQAKGAIIDLLEVDVSDKAALETALSPFTNQLRGLVHAAGALADAPLTKQSPQTFRCAFDPKARGAWNLHELTQKLPLDFFVLYSSAAGMFGTPGQANHAASNSFLDALARYRRDLKMPAQSIAWGPWSEIGSATRYGSASLRQIPGIEMIHPREGKGYLDALWSSTHTVVAVLPIDWAEFNQQRWSAGFKLSETSHRNEISKRTKVPSAPRLKIKDVVTLKKVVYDRIQSVLGFESDQWDKSKGFFDLGLDSLTALELKTTLERDLGIELPSTIVFDYPTTEAILFYLEERVLKTSPSAPTKKTVDITSQLDAKLDEMEALLEE